MCKKFLISTQANAAPDAHLQKLDVKIDTFLTCDMWHVTQDRWKEVNLLSKFQLPSSYRLGVKVFWRYFHNKDESIKELMTKVFVEQPRLHRVC